MTRLLLKDCRAYGPSHDGGTKLNLLIEEGVIAYMGTEDCEADVTVTSTIRDHAALLGIALIDHLIFASDHVFSMQRGELL